MLINLLQKAILFPHGCRCSLSGCLSGGDTAARILTTPDTTLMLDSDGSCVGHLLFSEPLQTRHHKSQVVIMRIRSQLHEVLLASHVPPPI